MPPATTPDAVVPPRRLSAWKIVVPILVLVVLAGAGIAFAWLHANPTVPDLADMTLQEVEAALTDAGLEVGPVDYDPSSTETTWTVIAQSVSAGDRAKRGSAIDITLAGPPPTEVPALSGLTRAETESAVASATLLIGSVTESYDATVPAGSVISQDPKPGVAVPESSPVALVVSKGPEPVGVPDVVGKAQADAEAALTAAGFTVKSSTKDDKAPKGSVLSQTPAGGTMAVPGTPVAIVVSTGVEMVKVPSWTSYDAYWSDDEYDEYGMGPYLDRLEQAIVAGFKKAGLKAVVTFDPDWHKDSYQTPKAGTMVPKGTTVKIMIYVAD